LRKFPSWNGNDFRKRNDNRSSSPDRLFGENLSALIAPPCCNCSKDAQDAHPMKDGHNDPMVPAHAHPKWPAGAVTEPSITIDGVACAANALETDRRDPCAGFALAAVRNPPVPFSGSIQPGLLGVYNKSFHHHKPESASAP